MGPATNTPRARPRAGSSPARMGAVPSPSKTDEFQGSLMNVKPAPASTPIPYPQIRTASFTTSIELYDTIRITARKMHSHVYPLLLSSTSALHRYGVSVALGRTRGDFAPRVHRWNEDPGGEHGIQGLDNGAEEDVHITAADIQILQAARMRMF